MSQQQHTNRMAPTRPARGRIVAIATALILASATWVYAGLATSVGLVVDLQYIGPTSDLVVSAQLVNVDTGRVLTTVSADKFSGGQIGANHRYSASLPAGKWKASEKLAWHVVVDATNAVAPATITSFEMNAAVEGGVSSYESLVSGLDISGSIAVERLFGLVPAKY